MSAILLRKKILVREDNVGQMPYWNRYIRSIILTPWRFQEKRTDTIMLRDKEVSITQVLLKL